jgi:hypothetical protein
MFDRRSGESISPAFPWLRIAGLTAGLGGFSEEPCMEVKSELSVLS